MSAPKTLSILDIDKYGDRTVAQYGIDKAYADFQVILDEYNKITMGMYEDLVAGETAEPRSRFGSQDSLDYVDMEQEFGRADAEAVTFSWYEVGLPLYKGGLGKQWTERYLQLESVERFNIQLNSALLADSRWLRKKVGQALFGNVNFTYKDKYVDGLPLFVKRLLNADGLPIPVLPEAVVQDPTNQAYSHYMCVTAINDTNKKAIENQLLEHVTQGNVVHYINKQEEPAWRALTGFYEALDPRIIQGVNTALLRPEFQDEYQRNFTLNDRFVGITKDGGEIWVKPWISAGTGFSFLKNSELAAPLVRRRDPIESSDMRLVEPIDVHPRVGARLVERIVGFGVAERRNGVCYVVDPANGGYVVPTIYS
jgi:hypothetical protein